jgi:hypothetical protein
VTLTGSVDCRKEPAERHEQHEPPPFGERRREEERDGEYER